MKKTFTKQFEWVMGMTGSTSCFSPTRRLLLLLCLILVGAGGAKAQSDVTFNEGVRYSQWVIDSRMNNFYANTTPCGFAVYNQNGTQTSARVDGKTKLDYVVGLVAKSIIEASQYYSQFTWAESFANPWFLSIKDYGDNFYSKFETNGGSLDDLNAVKLFIPLRELTATNGTYPDAATYANTKTALDNAIKGLNAHNTNYRIKDENILAKTAGNDVLGGWWHKSDYQNQMWLDGSYMGPALFAQLVNYSGKKTNIDSSNDWDLIVKQFTILHEMCWNETAKLPYHAFAADGGTNSTSHSDTWAGLSSKSPYVFHSASYWGRAVGWYFLALVDILEQMEKANLSSSDGYTILKGYLTEIADGLVKRQDKTTGGWYQILDKDGTYSASSYNGKTYTQTYNYIESSATALFTAAYLKAIRLGYLDGTTYKTVAENGYKCLVNNFFSVDANGKVNIFGSCRSAGLGGSDDRNAAGGERFRDGSNEYYLLGYDVAKVEKSENKTEGKVLGAFIMAATEYERANEKAIRFSYDLAPTYDLAQGGSITAEALGSDNISYQWFKSGDPDVSVATSATFAPTESGTYYCKATSGSTTIQTSETKVTVSETVTPSESTNAVVWTFTNSTLTSGTLGTAGNEVTFTSTDGSSTVMTYFSGSKDAIESSTATIGDVSYSSYLKENGTGSVNGNRRMEFKAPSSKGTVTIVYAERAGSTTIVDGSNSNKELATLTGQTNKALTTVVLTTTVGNKIIIYCPAKSYIYSVIWTPINEPTGPSISISTQPASAEYLTGATATALSVDVTFNNAAADDYDLSYQWYRNTVNSTTGGDEYSKEATCTPDVNTAGTTYYYCVVTAKKDGSETLTATSDVAAITVSEPNIEFTTQPTGAQYSKGDPATALSVEAKTNISGATPSYEWYSNKTGSIPDDKSSEKIPGETSATYTPSTESAGTTYYYCVASVENGSETLTATSDIVSVEVVGKLYSRKVTSTDTAPQCNESWYITGDTENDKLVKMTFGGWKWGTNEAKNDHSYVKPNTTSTVITDSWEGPAKQAKVTALDGYEYAISGKNDAVHEDKTATTNMYGSTRYGWFVSPERENGITTKSYPYTLPVRGAYMTFEPTKNGTLTVYLLQNGAWNSDTKNNIDIIPGQFRMHAFQITNQRGLVLEEFAPQYKITVNQKVMDGYTCSKYLSTNKPSSWDTSSKDISNWEEFWNLDDDERKAVHDNWANGTNKSQTIIKLKNGSFLAIQKAIVKYQFHVTGNETYYLFSNFSKLGFAGASFQPDDAQPSDETTFSGVNSLSDTKAYTQIEKVQDGTTIEGTNMPNYKYTINGTEVGKVDGVFIPQFKAITLKRTFKPNQWTTLTLPFNLTEEEVQKIFGDGTQLIQLNNAKVDNGCAKLTFIYHEIQNVLPGHPYLIKPTLTDITNDANVIVTKENNTITAFTVYNKCINPMIGQTDIDCGAYTFKGVQGYSTANQAASNINFSVKFKENDIFVSDSDGKMYVSAGNSYSKGYRAWFEKKVDTTDTTSGKINSISLVIDNPGDDDDNVVTTIDMVDVDPDVFNTLGIATGVYNLNGQKVSDDMRSLPKGIYIVNGKKIVRK